MTAISKENDPAQSTSSHNTLCCFPASCPSDVSDVMEGTAVITFLPSKRKAAIRPKWKLLIFSSFFGCGRRDLNRRPLGYEGNSPICFQQSSSIDGSAKRLKNIDDYTISVPDLSFRGFLLFGLFSGGSGVAGEYFGACLGSCQFQNRTLTARMKSSSGEKTVSRSGRKGAAVAAAKRVVSSSPKGTGRIEVTRL